MHGMEALAASRALLESTVVDSAAVLAGLWVLGVDFAQGYHLGRPQPLALLTSILPPNVA